MNASMDIQPTEIRELSLDEVNSVAGGAGNVLDFEIIRIMWWKDGAVSFGIQSVGSILVAPGSEGTSVHRD